MAFPFGKPQALKLTGGDYLAGGILQWLHTLYFTGGLLLLLLGGRGWLMDGYVCVSAGRR